MKRLFAMLLVLVMAFGLVACAGNNNSTTETPTTAGNNNEVNVMTYAEYMAAKKGDKVVIEAYVQAHQNWWDNKITVYLQDKDGAYFAYEMVCSEADAKKLTKGTKIRVSGVKTEWEGEIEIESGCTFEFIEGADSWVAEATDVTALLGTDDLIKHQNKFVSFKGVTVKSISYKNNEPTDDIYVTVTYNEKDYDFCVEFYLTGTETDVYKAFTGETIKVGDKVDIEGFLYWYKGVNTHITGIAKAN